MMARRDFLFFVSALLAAALASPSRLVADDDGGHGDSSGHGEGGGSDNSGHGSGGDDSGKGDDNGSGGDDDAGGASDSGDSDSSRRSSDQDEVLKWRKEGDIITLARALAITERKIPGKVIDVQLVERGERYYYRLKVRAETGAIRTLRLDARTGRFLGVVGL